MQKNLIVVVIVGISLFSGSLAHSQPTPKQEVSAADLIARATRKINSNQLYDLSYKLKKDAEIRWTVEMVAETLFSMAGQKEESLSRANCTKLWKVANVDSRGNMTFVYSLETIDMWKRIDEADPVRYNSETDEEVPEYYVAVANSVGRPHAIFTISPNGQVLDRHSNFKEDKFGVGKITIPLPGKPVAVGYQWSVQSILEANDHNNINRKIKARVLYELAKVKGKNAYIKFRTEILTPGISEKIRSTIMQQMTDGIIVFDIENGYHILKRVEWDEKAQGFEGADSLLEYVGRMSEKLISQQTTSLANDSILSPIQKNVAKQPVVLKTSDGAPVMRK